MSGTERVSVGSGVCVATAGSCRAVFFSVKRRVKRRRLCAVRLGDDMGECDIFIVV